MTRTTASLLIGGIALLASGAGAGPGSINLTAGVGRSGAVFVGDYPSYGYSYGYGYNPYVPARYRWGLGVGTIQVFGPRIGYGVGGRLGFPASTTFVVSPTRTVVWPPQPPQYAAAEPPVDPPEPVELARQALRAGADGDAVTLFDEHLAGQPSDYAAWRDLGVALIGDGRLRDGAAVLRTAYGFDPNLSSRPLGLDAVGGAVRARGLVRAAVRHANDSGVASAWFAVAVLMQTEGRDTVAAKMLARAGELGLEPEIVRPMAAALSARAVTSR